MARTRLSLVRIVQGKRSAMISRSRTSEYGLSPNSFTKDEKDSSTIYISFCRWNGVKAANKCSGDDFASKCLAESNFASIYEGWSKSFLKGSNHVVLYTFADFALGTTQANNQGKKKQYVRQRKVADLEGLQSRRTTKLVYRYEKQIREHGVRCGIACLDKFWVLDMGIDWPEHWREEAWVKSVQEEATVED